MTDLERLADILKTNRMDKKHEDWGFPRGWNEALEFVGVQIGKLGQEKSHKAGIENNTEHTN